MANQKRISQNYNNDCQLMSLVNSINKSSFLNCEGNTLANDHLNQASLQNLGSQQNFQSVNWSEKWQGIVLAQVSDSGGVVLKVTAKAAGFVLGCQGRSIRAICSKTGARSKSWMQCCMEQNSCQSLALRVFAIEGNKQQIIQAIQIVQAAVKRYSDLVQGYAQERKVSTEQIIEGIIFDYKPPPLSVMERAARTINSESEAKQRNSEEDSSKPSISAVKYPTVLPPLTPSVVPSQYPAPSAPLPFPYYPNPLPQYMPTFYPQTLPHSQPYPVFPFCPPSTPTQVSPRGLVPEQLQLTPYNFSAPISENASGRQ